jgi:hypothetical protein
LIGNSESDPDVNPFYIKKLPPTISTNSEEAKVGQGLDKTMFNRLMEVIFKKKKKKKKKNRNNKCM